MFRYSRKYWILMMNGLRKKLRFRNSNSLEAAYVWLNCSAKSHYYAVDLHTRWAWQGH